MGFAQEVRDFVAGYSAVRKVSQDDRRLDMDEKRIDFDVEYKEALLKIKQGEFDMKLENHQRALASSGAAAAARAEKDKIKGWDATLEDASTSYYSNTNTPGSSGDLNFSGGPSSAYNMGTAVPGESLSFYREGGLVEGDSSRWDDLVIALDKATTDEERNAIYDKMERIKRERPDVPYRSPAVPASPSSPDGMHAALPRSSEAGPRTAVPEVSRPRRELSPTAQGANPNYIPTPAVPPNRVAPVISKDESTEGKVYVPGKGYVTPNPGGVTAEESWANTGAEWRGVGDAMTDAAGAVLKPKYQWQGPPMPPEEAAPEAVTPEGNAQAIPEAGQMPAPPPEAPGAQGMAERQRPEGLEFGDFSSQIVIGRATEAMTVVLDDAARRIDLPQMAVGGEEGGADIVTGEGALTPEELEAIYAKVDPNGEIASHLSTAATLAEAYTYYKDLGQNQKAAAFATKFLAGEKALSQTLGMLAINAMEQGHTEEALRLFGDAITRFPTGHEIKMAVGPDGTLQYAVMEYGEVKDQGRLSGAEFMEMAGSVANGKLYMQAMMQFVDQNKQASKPRTAIPEIDAATAAYAAYNQAQARLEAIQDGTVPFADPDEYKSAIESAEIEVYSARDSFAQARAGAVEAARASLPKGKQNDIGALRDLQADVDGMITSKTAVPTSVGNDGGDGGGGLWTEKTLPPPTERKEGKVYELQDGRKFIWRGTGWEPVE
jgi:tetratricopeptide (TPR) repeat protein